MPATMTAPKRRTKFVKRSIRPADRLVRTARVTLARGRYSWLWIVPHCPYCGKQHDHYAGPLNHDPRAYLGSCYVARCDSTDRRRLTIEEGTASLWYVLLPREQAAEADG